MLRRKKFSITKRLNEAASTVVRQMMFLVSLNPSKMKLDYAGHNLKRCCTREFNREPAFEQSIDR